MTLRDVEQMETYELQEELARSVAIRIRYLLADTSSYFYVKLDPVMDRENSLGGGNFPIAAASVSCLEYFAIIHAHLAEGAGLWSEGAVARFEGALDRLKASQLLNSRDLSLILRPIPNVGGSRNAAESVRAFLKWLEAAGLKSGLPTEGGAPFQKVWDAFRNHLAHTMSPALGCTIEAAAPHHLREGGLTQELIREGARLAASEPFSREILGEAYNWRMAADVMAAGFLPAAAEELVGAILETEEDGALARAVEYARGAQFRPAVSPPDLHQAHAPDSPAG